MNPLFTQYLKELQLNFDHPDSPSNLAKICSYLICCGAAFDITAYANCQDTRTGNVGLQLLIDHSPLRVLIPTSYNTPANPLKITGDFGAGTGQVEYAGKTLCEVTFLPPVALSNKNIALEFDTLITAIPNNTKTGVRVCTYQLINKPCAFCALQQQEIQLLPHDLVTAYQQVVDIQSREPLVLLTGGTDLAKDRGLAKYLPYVTALRKNFPLAKIAIEASPPKAVSLLNPLIDAGIHTFAANLEFFFGSG